MRGLKLDLAMACLNFNRLTVASTIRAVVSYVQRAGGQLLTFTEFAKYDETPLKFRVKDASVKELEKAAQRAGLPTNLSGGTCEDALPAKLCNTESAIAIMFRMGEIDFCIRFGLCHWLQVMDSTHGEC